MKSIKVSEKTWKELQMLKIKHGFRSMDQVIWYLLEKHNEYVKRTLNDVLQSLGGSKEGKEPGKSSQ